MFLLDRAKNLSFGDVCGGVDVHEIPRCAVRLITREASARVGPFRPTLDISQMRIGNGLAIVAFDASDRIFGTFAEEGRKLSSEVVATAGLEFAEEIWSPL